MSRAPRRSAKANILRKLKLCVMLVLLATLALGTVAFMGYFKGVFASNLLAGVAGATDEINTTLKTREGEFAERKAALTRERDSRLGYDIAILQQTIPGPLWNVEPETAEAILKAFAEKPEIVAIRVDDDSGKLFAAIARTNGKPLVIKDAKDFKPGGPSRQAPLERGEKKIGLISLFYTDAPLQKQLAQVDEDLERFRRNNAALTSSIDGSLKHTIARQADRILQLRLIEMAAVFVVSIVTLTLFIRWNVVKPLRGMLGSLGDGSTQIEAAATQVAAGSQELATGTSKEAAAIEETSSTVEELTATTNRNAEQAGATERLSQEAHASMEEAAKAMRALFDSIQQIKTSSAETSKIVKTIDEISFQTNILALNAAVEAARAGSHGAGFAVVADEVRTLARRAAESAKDTSQLIDKTHREIDEAVRLVETTRTTFDVVNRNVDKTTSFVTEIAAASGEQAKGLQLLNSNLTQIDHVVQQTVANAEQSAAAAEEMCAQTAQMNQVIADLRRLVGVLDEPRMPRRAQAQDDDAPTVAESARQTEQATAG